MANHLHLVTGGAGFIGSNLVHRLAREGQAARVFDDLSSGRFINLAGIEDKVDFVQADLCDLAAVREAMRGVRYVFHFGALASVQASVDDPLRTHDINVTGTLNVLVAARDAAVQRVVFASSASVYGDSPIMPKREDMLPQPQTGYALSKLAGEHYAAFLRAVRLAICGVALFQRVWPASGPRPRITLPPFRSSCAPIPPAASRRFMTTASKRETSRMSKMWWRPTWRASPRRREPSVVSITLRMATA